MSLTKRSGPFGERPGRTPTYLFPRHHVRTALLDPGDKGIAHYWSVRAESGYDKDLVWTYPEPFHEAEAVRGLVCFPQETVDVEVTS